MNRHRPTPAFPAGETQGYTLIEVVISAALLGIMLIIFFAGLASGLAMIRTSREGLRATQILTQKTEAIRLCTWSELTNLPTTFQAYYRSYSLGSTNGTASTVYYGTISVGSATNIPDTVSYRDQVRLVTLSLVWTNELGGHPVVHQRQMQTLAAYHGLVNYIYGTQ